MSPETAMEQSSQTAEYYLTSALRMLKEKNIPFDTVVLSSLIDAMSKDYELSVTMGAIKL